MLSVITLIAIPYVQLKLQPRGIQRIPPAILLPMIAAQTSAAGCGVICSSTLISDRPRVPVILISYLEIGAGFAVSIAFTAVVLLEHFNGTNPDQNKSGIALQVLGTAVLRDSFANYNRGTLLTEKAAEPIGYISQFGGLLSWAFSTFWWCFALGLYANSALNLDS
ncbi:hypothetical protein FE257_003751 [Aspergillus nanangensis]|uniref:Uncharacterized protein n=1 Tax=Aspergillus nanangensis TaxID=2582783 RepID=A0AAD4GPH0_ASPNN|nr:hypothetical protein FE257_003751 [Aspergillus nanangensis]